MKHFNIVVINGEEKEISSLSKEERQRLIDEWNRRAFGASWVQTRENRLGGIKEDKLEKKEINKHGTER